MRRRTALVRALATVTVMVAALTIQIGQAAVAAAATATFGQTTVGSASVPIGAGYKFGTAFSLTTTGTAQSFSLYARGGVASQRLTPLIYRTTAAGDPSTLVTTGSEVTIAANQAPGWVTAALPAVTLTPGIYLLGLASGPTDVGAYVYYDPIANAGVWNENTYPTAPTTWGAVNREAIRWSYYVTYTTPDGPPVNTAPPAITGAAQTGATLTASTGT